MDFQDWGDRAGIGGILEARGQQVGLVGSLPVSSCCHGRQAPGTCGGLAARGQQERGSAVAGL